MKFVSSCFLIRLCRPDDGHQCGERHAVSDLGCGEATGVYRGHWRHLLVDPHDFQRVALPSPEEEKRPEQHIHWHPQGCVFHCYVYLLEKARGIEMCSTNKCTACMFKDDHLQPGPRKLLSLVRLKAVDERIKL